jgi:nicotinamidase-related amidase
VNTPPPVDPLLAVDPVTSALVTIDLQQDFLSESPNGVPGTTEVLPRVFEVVEAFRDAGRPVIHIVRLYEKGGADADLVRRALLASGVELVAPYTPGSGLADGLGPVGAPALDPALLLGGGVQDIGPREYVIFKPRWGAFHRTPLDGFLRDRGITSLVFVGCNLPNCPRASMVEASERDYRVAAVPEALSRTTAQGLAEVAGIGVQLLSVQEVQALFRSAADGAR